jgi:putative NADH-flavin reductase
MFYTSYQPYKPFVPFGPAAQGTQFGYGEMSEQSTQLLTSGINVAGKLASSGLSAHAAKVMEREKRKTKKATQKFDDRISASKAKQEEAKAKAASAEAEARRVEAEQAAQSQNTRYLVLGGVGVTAIVAGVFIAKTLKRRSS